MPATRKITGRRTLLLAEKLNGLNTLWWVPYAVLLHVICFSDHPFALLPMFVCGALMQFSAQRANDCCVLFAKKIHAQILAELNEREEWNLVLAGVLHRSSFEFVKPWECDFWLKVSGGSLVGVLYCVLVYFGLFLRYFLRVDPDFVVITPAVPLYLASSFLLSTYSFCCAISADHETKDRAQSSPFVYLAVYGTVGLRVQAKRKLKQSGVTCVYF
jgi:hypothetical protein